MLDVGFRLMASEIWISGLRLKHYSDGGLSDVELGFERVGTTRVSHGAVCCVSWAAKCSEVCRLSVVRV